MHLAKTTILALSAVAFAACSMADFRAADTRRNLLLKDVHKRVGALNRLVDSKPNPLVAGAIKAETKQLNELVDAVGKVDAGGESAREELIAKEAAMKTAAKSTQTVIDLNKKLEALHKKVKERLTAAAKTPPKDKKAKAAIAKLKELDDDLTKFDPTAAKDLAGAIEVFERRYATQITDLEEENPDKLAQADLRRSIQDLIERGKKLRDWGDASRETEIEKIRSELTTLLGIVPDPKDLVITAAKREEAAAKAKGLEKRVAKLERDYQVLVAPWFRAHGGSITVSPYSLRRTGGQPSFELEENSNTTYYVELDFHHRKAWLKPEHRFEVDPDSSWLTQLISPDDHELRLRFMGDTEVGDTTAASASAGDFMIEGSSGWNLAEFQRHNCEECQDNPEYKVLPAGSLNFELNAGITTNRSITDSHNYIQAGLVSAWSFPMQLADRTYRSATVLGGVYYGIHEFPRLDVGDTVYTEARRPHYNHLGALGVRLDFTIPLTTNLEFIAGARYFSPVGRDDLPDDWSLFLGASLPLGRIVRSLIGDPQ